MRKSFFLSFDQSLGWPDTQVGQLGSYLGQLRQLQIPVYPGFIVPAETLLTLVEHNHLDQKLQQWFQIEYLSQESSHGQVTKLHTSLKKIFKHLFIPAEISEQFLEQYYHVGHNQKVSITASWIRHENQDVSVTSEPVKGDATVFETLLETWSESVWAALLDSPPQTTKLSTIHFAPAALIVQTHHKAELSGFVLTSTPTEHKAIYSVFLDSEAGSPCFKIDIRTWQVIASCGCQDRRHNHLSAAQALEAAQLAHTIKVRHFFQLKVSWELHQNQVVISNVIHLQDLENSLTEPSSTPSPLILGTTVTRGEVSGSVEVIKGQLPLRWTPKHPILAISELSKLQPSQLTQLKGVITDKGISLSTQTLLRTHHIPTLIQTRVATSRLKTGMSIELNTLKNAVFAAATAREPSTSYTTLPVLAEVSTAFHTGQTEYLPEAFVFHADTFWSRQELSPLTQIEHQPLNVRKLLFETVSSYQQTGKPLIYRPYTFASSQLGYQGAVRLLRQHQVLDFELEVIRQLTKEGQTLHVITPLTRTAAEHSQLSKYLRSKLPPNIPIWWEAAYPENLINIKSYSLKEMAGVIINLPAILLLLYGLDQHNFDLQALYHLDPAVLHHLLEHAKTAFPKEKIWLQTTLSHVQLSAEAVVENQLAGVMGALHDLPSLAHTLQTTHRHWLITRKALH